jgi:hypothetical protein
LDRTNVAQFSAGVEAIGQQLVVMGIRSRGKLGPSSSIVRVLIDMYVDIGDSIALQYGGSEAHKKVTAGVSESNITGPIGKHKELLTSIRRYYSNAFTDRLKQDAMNLFLGYYLPFRHSIPLWEMENDYYLHNFHVKAGKGTTTSMKTYQRAFGIEWREDEESTDGVDPEPPFKSTSSAAQQWSTASRARSTRPNISSSGSSSSWEGESKRVTQVRNRCKAQNVALSTWWKVALQSNIKDRMWIRLGNRHDESLLPQRFERVYQPEKLGQFDRFFSRTWETPVRRSHAAQHSEGVEDDDAIDFSRVISNDFASPSRTNQNHRQVDSQTTGGIPLQKFVTDYGFEPRTESALKLFAEHYNQAPICPSFEYVNQSDAAPMKSPPDEYLRYCAPSSQAFEQPQSYRVDRVEEFKQELRDFTLPADDVAGIRELARSAHLSETIFHGEYRGLNKDTSAIDVATAIHEQFNTLEALPSAGQQMVERELVRRGFDTTGMKEAVAAGWKRFTSAEKQYLEVVEANVARCQRSELTSADSLKLYASEFDKSTILTTADRIFLQAYARDTTNDRRPPRPSGQSTEPSPFVQKAARLGISITPHARRAAAVPPPLYQAEQRQDVPPGFEQINEDMFSRKDNKFMVFNGAGKSRRTGASANSSASSIFSLLFLDFTGVDSWTGTKPITKISHAEDILRSTFM